MFQFLTDVLSSNIAQALIIAALTAIAGNYMRPKGKLVWSVSHQHYYSIPNVAEKGGTFPVRTQQIWVQNLGRSSIEDIEIVLNWKPQHYEVWDPRHYAPGTLPDGRHTLRFPNLSSREFFRISILDTINDLPMVMSVRWKDGLGRQIVMTPQEIHPNWKLIFVGLVMLIGATAIIFGALQGIIYLASLAPTAAVTSP
ncbi:hypothetical protein ELI54_30035 (plasmid) [Rhizobium ruizarguesonis]|jgi:hypothetical protein|uniref:hypothetical protein n=1 Tax=Rhizobium ruizarguesonis TaxID=2081791 RepID=UPI0010318D89|nr:hypothetical protein [Rhizobium ruizarguesonis]MBY5884547.1 hypothetical protein [Rhizobium leguminosarum]TAT72153.1 hypothetical protein ELI56_31245 [Rhizobium ruizarguesonis]TAT75803.1 hypothetical protein ELI54_30035 [Rhizobium ruizarguesonis]TAZ67737.1 hypothetical protein ELH70_29660 [Rhizobium ruizarguesonis]TAZ89053.1 hypothetical protein ELH69_33835 [Rhizobium ruizarguesonis]